MPSTPSVIDESEIQLLEGILLRNHSYAKQLDTYANIMIALSSAIFIFSFSQLRIEQSLFWMILGLTTGLATILSLMMVRPPKTLRKRGQQESLMYSREIVSFTSPQEYKRAIDKVLASRDEIINQYSKEIYNLTKYYYLPKKLLFRIAKGVLTTGISISLILFLLEYFT